MRDFTVKGADFMTSFMMFRNHTNYFNLFSDESVGKVMKSVCNYVFEGKEPEGLDKSESTLFEGILESIETCSAKYVAERREKEAFYGK